MNDFLRTLSRGTAAALRYPRLRTVRGIVAASLLCSLTLFAAPTLAQSALATELASPTTDDALAERTAFIADALERETLPSARWRWGWSMALGAFAAGNVVRAVVAHAMNTNDWPAGWVAATGSALGMLNMVLFAPRGQYASREFRAVLHRAELSPLDRVRQGERLLRAVAKNEDFNAGPASQALRVGVPIAMGLALELGFALHTAAILNVAGGIAIGQVTVRTAPTGAVTAWERYVRRWPDADGGPLRRWSAPIESLTVALRPGGVVLGGTF